MTIEGIDLRILMREEGRGKRREERELGWEGWEKG